MLLVLNGVDRSSTRRQGCNQAASRISSPTRPLDASTLHHDPIELLPVADHHRTTLFRRTKSLLRVRRWVSDQEETVSTDSDRRRRSQHHSNREDHLQSWPRRFERKLSNVPSLYRCQEILNLQRFRVGCDREDNLQSPSVLHLPRQSIKNTSFRYLQHHLSVNLNHLPHFSNLHLLRKPRRRFLNLPSLLLSSHQSNLSAHRPESSQYQHPTCITTSKN